MLCREVEAVYKDHQMRTEGWRCDSQLCLWLSGSAALIGLVFWAFPCKLDPGLCKCAVQTQSLLTVASGCAGMWDKGWTEGLHLFLSIKTASILFVLYEILAQSIQRKDSEALRICFWKAALAYLLVPILCTPSLRSSKINMNPWVAAKESPTPFQKTHG